jgi:acyl-CoA synthetase (AMP-forming)/AMP-acid ligase II
VVAMRDGMTVSVADLRAFCRERLAPYKVPKEFRFASRVPRDAQGKLSRKEITRSLRSRP